jgi:hypothetical protein
MLFRLYKALTTPAIRQDAEGSKTIGFLIGLLGVLVIGVAAFWALHTHASVAEMLPGHGTVIALEPKNRPHKAPVVEFTVYGQRHQFTEKIRSRHPGFEIGEPVALRYDPRDPNNARISTPWKLYGGPGAIAVFGLIFAGAGILAWIRAGQRSQRTLPGPRGAARIPR